MVHKDSSRRPRPRRRPVLRLSVRELLRELSRLAPRQWAELVLLACPFALGSLAIEQALIRACPNTIADSRVAAIISFYGATALACLSDAAIAAYVVPRVMRGPAAASYRIGAKHVLMLLVLALVAPLGVLAGVAVAVVPGIIVAISWCVAPAVTILNGASPFAALRHSAQLTWGSRKSLFFVFAAAHVVSIALSCVGALAAGQSVSATLFDATPASPRDLTVGGVLESIRFAFSGTVCAMFFAAASAAESPSR